MDSARGLLEPLEVARESGQLASSPNQVVFGEWSLRMLRLTGRGKAGWGEDIDFIKTLIKTPVNKYQTHFQVCRVRPCPPQNTHMHTDGSISQQWLWRPSELAVEASGG